MVPRAALAVALLCAAFAGTVALRPPPPDLVVLCSNVHAACTQVVDAYAEATGRRVTLVRLPTSEGLTRLRATRDTPEFDVWLGGPAEAYVVAADEGLLARSDPSTDAVPASFRDPEGRWFGTYGGVLSFCVTAGAPAPRTWAELLDPRFDGRVAVPNPLTSGTAATMLWVHYERLGSQAEATDYLVALDDQLATYTESGSNPAGLVATERVDVGVSFAPYCENERRAGSDVEVALPADGTGFEVGAVALLDGAQRSRTGAEFVQFAVSTPGQLAGARAAGQLPVDAALPGNLGAALDRLDVPVFGTDIVAAGRMRSALIGSWAREVRGGTY